MFKLDTADDLLDAFRPKDRKTVDITTLKFPLVVKDYVAWPHPGGGKVFIVFATPGGAATGIAFDTNGAATSVPAMCSWCHCSAGGTGVGLLTATVNGNKRVGVHVCTDLSCSEKLEDAANRTGASVRPAMEKLITRIGQFASDALKIDLSGAGR